MSTKGNMLSLFASFFHVGVVFFLCGIFLVHRSKSLSRKQGIPIMPLVWLNKCVILWHSHLTGAPALLP